MSLPEELRAARPAGPRTIGGAASTWLERHAQSLVGSLGRLARQPFATALTIAVIGIALALPTALYLVVANMRAVTADLGDTVQLSVYPTPPPSTGATAQSKPEPSTRPTTPSAAATPTPKTAPTS
jgi:cell division transport system permease protein